MHTFLFFSTLCGVKKISNSCDVISIVPFWFLVGEIKERERERERERETKYNEGFPKTWISSNTVTEFYFSNSKNSRIQKIQKFKNLPRVLQEWLCEFKSQSYSFHALEGKQFTHPVKMKK